MADTEQVAPKPEPKWLRSLSWLPEWARDDIREVSAAPRAVVVIVALGFGAGWWGASQFYAERFLVMRERLEGLQERLNQAAPKQTIEPEDIIQGWSGGSLDVCGAEVNGERIASLARTHDAILMCGLRRPDVDRVTDSSGVSISQRFSIEPKFSITMPISSAMDAEMTSIAAKLPRPDVPVGTPLRLGVQLWYEIALVPKQLDLSVIRSLADVERFGGLRFPEQGRGSTIQKVVP